MFIKLHFSNRLNSVGVKCDGMKNLLVCITGNMPLLRSFYELLDDYKHNTPTALEISLT